MGYSTEEEYEKFICDKNKCVPEIATLSNTCDSENVKKKCKTLHKCTYEGCNKLFSKPSRLQWHLRQHTGERPFKCEFNNCDKTYTTSSHLKRHLRTHSSVQNSIKCDVCQLILKSRDNYRKHYQRVHNNKNRISCNECSAVFRKKSKLDEHMAIHNNITSFKCEKCCKIFSSIYLMKKHEKSIHNRILKCIELNCNEEFFRFIDLRIHRKKAHPKEFHCHECDKRFFTKSALKQHMQAHEFSLLSCPYDKCSKIYSFQRNLQYHIKKHHLACQMYYCDMCGVGVSEKSSLIRHIRKIHLIIKTKDKKRSKHGSERQRRKDAGLPHKSALTKLIGLNLPRSVEQKILNRIPTKKFSDSLFEFGEDLNENNS